MSALTALLGVAIVVATIAQGGGPLAFGVVVGVGLAIVGAGRFLLARDAAGRREP